MTGASVVTFTPTAGTKTPGVYRIRLLSDGRCYIGSSINVAVRWTQHRTHLRQGKHASAYLQRTWNKYGEQAFAFELLEICAPERDAILAAEQKWLDSEAPVFNTATVAGSTLGTKRTSKVVRQPHSDETKQKIREAHLGMKASPETRAKMSASRKNRPCSPETRAKISAANSGRVVGDETRAKMSASAQARWAAVPEEERMAIMAQVRAGHASADD